jgi:hypothetical protein
MDSLNQSRSSNPLHVIACTSYIKEETCVFEANENGEITSPECYGCIAKRLGHNKWDSSLKAVRFLFPYKMYYLIKNFGITDGVHRILYERYDPENPIPNEVWEFINKVDLS